MVGLFRDRHGYDLREKLPLLVYRGLGFEKVRYDFACTLTERFLESFTRPYSERCAKLGLKLTGHYNEDVPSWQIAKGTGAAMPHYWYQQMPGIDHLMRNIKEPWTLKQASSVAHQKGRSEVLSEIYGVSGHSAT